MCNKVWILTESYNDYDQHGEYFVAFWPSKPSLEELAKFFQLENGNNGFPNAMAALAFLQHVHNGGGRQGVENSWYDLHEVEKGKTL